MNNILKSRDTFSMWIDDFDLIYCHVENLSKTMLRYSLMSEVSNSADMKEYNNIEMYTAVKR